MFGARHYAGLQRKTWVNAPICAYIIIFIWSLFFPNVLLSNCPQADYNKFDILSLCANLPCHHLMFLCKTSTCSVSCYKINVGLWSITLLIKDIWQYQPKNYEKMPSWATERSSWRQPQLKEFVLNQFSSWSYIQISWWHDIA